MKRSIVAAVAALALLVPASSALASEQPVGPCPPGSIGVTVYYRDPRGWITLDIPLCFVIRH